MENSLSPLAKEILNAGQYWVDGTPPYWYIVNTSLGIVIILAAMRAFLLKKKSKTNRKFRT